MLSSLPVCLLVVALPIQVLSSDCVQPPVVPNASVKQVAQYRCDPEYISCYESGTSVLRPNGQWDPMPESCDRFIYYNLEKWTIYHAPCEPSSYLKMKFLVTMKVDTKALIAVVGGSDTLFQVSFRQNSTGDVDKTILNSKIDGSFGEKVTLPKNYLSVGQVSVVIITYEDGVYELEVDGTSVASFPERLAGVKPDGCRFSKEFAVYSLTMTIAK